MGVGPRLTVTHWRRSRCSVLLRRSGSRRCGPRIPNAWAGANGFDLLTAPFFFPDHRDQQRLLGVYRDSLRTHGHDPARKEIMAVYHMYCGEHDADIAAIADPALGRYQAFTKATDLSRQAYRDPVAYKDWKGFFENRETITLKQMKALR